jgi:hypothetical protein
MHYNTGEEYEGDWKNGMREGQGNMQYPNAERYEGDWIADKKEGLGKELSEV